MPATSWPAPPSQNRVARDHRAAFDGLSRHRRPRDDPFGRNRSVGPGRMRGSSRVSSIVDSFVRRPTPRPPSSPDFRWTRRAGDRIPPPLFRCRERISLRSAVLIGRIEQTAGVRLDRSTSSVQNAPRRPLASGTRPVQPVFGPGTGSAGRRPLLSWQPVRLRRTIAGRLRDGVGSSGSTSLWHGTATVEKELYRWSYRLVGSWRSG